MSPTIMLIEDNALHRKLFSAWLEIGGYQVHALSDERAAYVEATRLQPSGIISDIRLAFSDGRSIIRELKRGELTSHIPIMAMTVLSGLQEEESCYAAGADLFIQKPTRFGTFMDNVNLLIGTDNSGNEIKRSS